MNAEKHPQSGKTYLVGGAVRDQLLGLEVHDRDYVVVGSDVPEMIRQGYKQVGKDFPIFLHPTTGEEYALARTQRHPEQGASNGLQGVTLEQDLGRRDFTVNAMAQGVDGILVDPYGGQADLRNKVLRHVSPVTFSDDPLRVLRLARFCARYEGFVVAPETMGLARRVVTSGVVGNIPPERIWQELSRGLMEKNPLKMIGVLRETGALKAIMPELDVLFGIVQPKNHHPEIDTGLHVLMVLEQAVGQGAPLEVRFAALMHDLGKGLSPKDTLPAHHGHEESGVALVRDVCNRLRVPSSVRDLAILVCAEHTRVHRSEVLKNSSVVSLLERADAFRRPKRFELMLQACECDAKGRLGLKNRAYPQKDYMTECLRRVMTVNVGEIVQSCKNKDEIPMRIHQARISSLSGLQRDDYFAASDSKNSEKVKMMPR